MLLSRQILSPDCQTQIMNEKKQEPENHGNKELMAAVTGALWKLSMSEDNVKCFQVIIKIILNPSKSSMAKLGDGQRIKVLIST